MVVIAAGIVLAVLILRALNDPGIIETIGMLLHVALLVLAAVVILMAPLWLRWLRN